MADSDEEASFGESQADVLSQRSENDDPKITFKKHPWLSEFFQYNTQGSKITVKCKYCNTGYKSRSLSRLITHCQKCQKIPNRQNIPAVLSMNLEKNPSSSISLDWAKVMVENNISTRTLESSSFKYFMARHVKNWKIPERGQFTGMIIPQLSRAFQCKFQTKLGKQITYLSIEFDHWTDVTGKSIFGVIGTTISGQRFLIDLKDVSLKDHSSYVIVEDLREILEKFQPTVINSIISDGAFNCRKAREEFVRVEGFEHVIQHRCLAHLFNNIGKRITTENKTVAETLRIATNLTNIVSNSTYWTAYMRLEGYAKIHSACPVRWYSTVIMITRLIDLKTVIMRDILAELNLKNTNILMSLDWNQLTEILETLKPLNKCIGALEKKDISLGEAFKQILEYCKTLFSDKFPSEFVIQARKSFLWHFDLTSKYWWTFGLEQMGLHIAAYVLDRRNNMDYITDDGVDLALESITRIALKSGVTLRKCESYLVEEFEYYIENTGGYGPMEPGQSVVDWWMERQSNGPLAKVALRLAHLKASSANIERVFSTVKHIQGGKMSISPETLVHIGRLRIAAKDEILDEERLDDLDYEAIKNDNEVNHQRVEYQIQDDSPDTSISSNGSSISDSTFLEGWLTTTDKETKRRYSEFFKYFDFNLVHRQGSSTSQQIHRVTEEDIQRVIRGARAVRQPVYDLVSNPIEEMLDLNQSHS